MNARVLDPPAVLIFNPTAGEKLGLSTNTGGPDEVQDALRAAGIPFDARSTERAGHATELARAAVSEGRKLVIVAGGDGTVGEVAQSLARTTTVLGVMPLGSVMNMARTLCIPREFDAAAQVIASGRVLAMDLGLVGETYFLEAAGVGLDAGLFGYFEQLDSRGVRFGILRAAWRFLRNLGTPSLIIDVAGRTHRVRAPMVSVANGPFVGAAYAIAPNARINDGLLDVVVFRGLGVLRVLVHFVAVLGGRRLASPPGVATLRVRMVRIATRGGRPLPVHADGTPVGATPMQFEVVPGALQVLTGQPEEGAACAWQQATNA